MTECPADHDGAFAWVDEYLAHVRPFFEVRQEDSLLIVLPNRAVKLNASAIAILRHLKMGGSIEAVLSGVAADRQRRRDLFYFLCDFRCLMSEGLGEGRGRKAVDIVPHPEQFNVLPVLSEVAVTYRCNLRCEFCYAACGCWTCDEPDAREMSTDDVVRVLEIIRRDAKVPSVSFTGGEPLLRGDLEELVASAAGLGLRVNLITNACLLAGNRRAASLRKAGLASAQVSLEGPDSDVHDGLTGVYGSFEKTLAGLTAIREAGVHVHTNTTINAANVEHLDRLVQLVAEMGLRRMSMNMVVPTGAAANLRLQVCYEDIGAVVQRVRQAAIRCGVEFMWYSPTPLCLFNPLANGLGNKSCAACDGLLSISPTGDVLPCSSCAEPVGNLLRQPFDEVWQSARATFFRRKEFAPEECDGCESFRPCTGACPLYWSAMGTKELARVSRQAHAVT